MSQDFAQLTTKEAEVVVAVVKWMREGPTHSNIQLHKGGKPEFIKVRMEVNDALGLLVNLTNKTN